VAGGLQSTPIPGLESAGLDSNALLFTGAMNVLAACGFGLMPAIRFSREQLGTLRQAVFGRITFTRDALVVLQTASALALLVGSALLVRSFWKLSRVDPGYDTKGILTFQISPDRQGLGDRAAVSQFQYAFMDRLAALRGVQSVGYINVLPLDEAADADAVTSARIRASGAEPPLVHVAAAGGAYFQTMGIELLSGRFFDRIEEQQAAKNVIISRTAAELLFPGEDPLGEQVLPLANDDDQTGYTVIGVVEDVVLDDFRRGSRQPTVYVPGVGLSPAYVVKSARAGQLVPEIRAIIREVIPESPMYRVFTMEQLAANSMATLSFTMLMLGIAAAIAVILGAVGIYAVLSHGVAQRTREIAVRMALGAEPPGLRRMIVLQGGRLALIGVGIGVVIAFVGTRLLKTLLFGVQALDLPTFLAMSILMLAVALLASYVPARRASAVDLMRSLRT
jgi:predicted permease